MRDALRDLSGLGVEWVAIHPYAGISKNGHVRYTPAEETGYLSRAVQMANAAGVKLFLKPHLGYWGSGFSWAGDVQFGSDEAAWRRFFDGYRAFILDQARFAEKHGIPLFAVGTECEGTTHRREEWGRIIAEIRKVYSGRITYAANWDRVDRVPFWSALDLVGLQAYFPVGDGPDLEREAVERAWDRHVSGLEKLSRDLDKPIFFSEIGYARSKLAAKQPWEPAVDSSGEAIELRRLLMDVAFDRMKRTKLIRGAFWWKWIPGSGWFDRDFSMKDEEARTLLRKYWGAGESSALP